MTNEKIVFDSEITLKEMIEKLREEEIYEISKIYTDLENSSYTIVEYNK